MNALWAVVDRGLARGSPPSAREETLDSSLSAPYTILAMSMRDRCGALAPFVLSLGALVTGVAALVLACLAYHQDREIAAEANAALETIEDAVETVEAAVVTVERTVAKVGSGSTAALEDIHEEVMNVRSGSTLALEAIENAVNANTNALLPRLQVDQLVGVPKYDGAKASLTVYHVASVGVKHGTPVLRHIPNEKAFENWGCKWEDVIVLDSLTWLLTRPVIGDPYPATDEDFRCSP